LYAPIVVVAAWCDRLERTPSLERIKRNVGTRLSFNAGAMMVAEFDETLDAYDADQMTTYLKTTTASSRQRTTRSPAPR